MEESENVLSGFGQVGISLSGRPTTSIRDVGISRSVKSKEKNVKFDKLSHNEAILGRYSYEF